MLLSIPEPAIFYCEADEEHFFAWLERIPAIKAITGTSEGLALTTDEPMDKLSSMSW